MDRVQPTADDVRSVFEYRDGALFRRSNGMRGYERPDGYVYTRLLGSSFGEHRLVHLLFTGEWPYQVDHKNGIRSDNRPENLRSATHSQNCFNRKPLSSHHKGCYWQPKRKKWIAQIGVDGSRKTIGYFDTETEAADAYRTASKQLHGEFGRAE